MPFRDDILRGIRLFAISFAVLLVCVWAYRVTRAPSGVEGASQDPRVPTEAAQPAPAAETTAAPLVVPPPPPVHRVTHLRADDTVPPPPSRAVHRAPVAPLVAEAPIPPPAPVVPKPADPPPVSPKDTVGYKSLIEANAGQPPVEPVFPNPPDSAAKRHKGNRFLHVLGKILHPGRPE